MKKLGHKSILAWHPDSCIHAYTCVLVSDKSCLVREPALYHAFTVTISTIPYNNNYLLSVFLVIHDSINILGWLSSCNHICFYDQCVVVKRCPEPFDHILSKHN
jgi:hypothetical protein